MTKAQRRQLRELTGSVALQIAEAMLAAQNRGKPAMDCGVSDMLLASLIKFYVLSRETGSSTRTIFGFFDRALPAHVAERARDRT